MAPFSLKMAQASYNWDTLWPCFLQEEEGEDDSSSEDDDDDGGGEEDNDDGGDEDSEDGEVHNNQSYIDTRLITERRLWTP